MYKGLNWANLCNVYFLIVAERKYKKYVKSKYSYYDGSMKISSLIQWNISYTHSKIEVYQ